MPETLARGASPFGRGGLPGRYATEIMEHLNERRDLVASGVRENITIFWDIENMDMPKTYDIRPMKLINRTMSWLAGVLDATVTRLEAVEFTRESKMSQAGYGTGVINWYTTMRMLGAVVHRAWPPIDDGAAIIIFERFRHHLDRMLQGGPKSILCVVSPDPAFTPMLEAAQSEGVTVVRITCNMEAIYYPGGRNFSIPMDFPRWLLIKNELLDDKVDPFRPEEEWTLEQGPKRMWGGPVQLDYAGPEEELDKRIFHSWINRTTYDTANARFTGAYRRAGMPMNDTIFETVYRDLMKWNRNLTQEEKLALDNDMESLKSLDEKAHAALFWNYENHPLKLKGPDQREMLARLVRWFGSWVGMPITRVQVAQFIEPWHVIGHRAYDWTWVMQKLGMIINRIWPRRDEAANQALSRSIAAIVRAVRSGAMEKAPRVLIILTDEFIFDEAVVEAQAAGITTICLNSEQRGTFYPANSKVTVQFDWFTWRAFSDEICRCNCDPHIPGAPRPDAPLALGRPSPVPTNLTWGAPDTLNLDASETYLAPVERLMAYREAHTVPMQQ